METEVSVQMEGVGFSTDRQWFVESPASPTTHQEEHRHWRSLPSVASLFQNRGSAEILTTIQNHIFIPLFKKVAYDRRGGILPQDRTPSCEASPTVCSVAVPGGLAYSKDTLEDPGSETPP